MRGYPARCAYIGDANPIRRTSVSANRSAFERHRKLAVGTNDGLVSIHCPGSHSAEWREAYVHHPSLRSPVLRERPFVAGTRQPDACEERGQQVRRAAGECIRAVTFDGNRALAWALIVKAGRHSYGSPARDIPDAACRDTACALGGTNRRISITTFKHIRVMVAQEARPRSADAMRSTSALRQETDWRTPWL